MFSCNGSKQVFINPSGKAEKSKFQISLKIIWIGRHFAKGNWGVKKKGREAGWPNVYNRLK